MLVVADSSPLNLVVRIGHADVLPALFQRAEWRKWRRGNPLSTN